MTKIYLVSSGFGSSYAVDEVYSTLEKAKQFCCYYNKDNWDGFSQTAGRPDKYDDYCIEERALDPKEPGVTNGSFLP